MIYERGTYICRLNGVEETSKKDGKYGKNEDWPYSR